MCKLVFLESPFRGDDNHRHLERNIEYARRCMRDCLMRGEFPLAPHLLYTQHGILDDKKLEERNLGILAGLAWAEHADKTVAYTDLGITEGMEMGIRRAEEVGRPVEKRNLEGW